MSRRRRRVAFAAPLVLVVASAGCSSKPERPAGTGGGSGSTAGPGAPANRITWTVGRRAGDECRTIEDDCDPGVKCNPPPPVRFRCPPGAPATGTFTITSADGRTCYLGDSTAVVPCPDDAPPPSPIDAATPAPIDAGTEVAAGPALRRWNVLRRGDACQAAEDPCTGAFPPGQPAPPCNPPPPTKLACPPTEITAIVERAPGDCIQIEMPNLGPVGAPVPCPP